MSERFNVLPVLRGHWKGLTDGRDTTRPRADIVARLSLLLPVAVFALMLGRGGRLAAPAALLTGVALMAGGMLSAFTHLSTLRLKITEWDSSGGASRFEVERGMLDETAAHLLTGSLVCAFDAAALVIGMNVGATKAGQLQGFWAALAAGLSSYVLIVFIFVIPRLYSAYVEINNVSSELNGFDRSKRRKG
ncbi:hypothetical protein [Streptomyces sp. NBC_01750]|uniref:hypothetical protein n=1 Tax=Streptomyces sp. NBC_01750 TaxID=2975928 RepID=UPI002DD7C0A7|nr:hypothetical protein [Streptomyces sp. NBC_01750]WSD34392.1 hypothetical protein OG966_22405 [Streptomyces sp. NBC_01750]